MPGRRKHVDSEGLQAATVRLPLDLRERLEKRAEEIEKAEPWRAVTWVEVLRRYAYEGLKRDKGDA